jgi:hypothetical protein
MTEMVFGFLQKPKWLGEKRMERTMNFIFFFRKYTCSFYFLFT